MSDVQKCCIHILKDSKDLAKHYKEAEVIHKRLKSIYKQAKSYNHKATDKEVNKLAERTIRKAVIIRKMSNGNRSKNGAKFLEILLSILSIMETFQTSYE